MNARHIANVWNVLSLAEQGGLEQNTVLARTYILRLLQRAGLLPSHPEERLFEKAATIPLEDAPQAFSDLSKYSALFE